MGHFPETCYSLGPFICWELSLTRTFVNRTHLKNTTYPKYVSSTDGSNDVLFFSRMRVKKLPHILALHLKRFKYMEQLNRYTKLSYRVVFPLELRLFNTVSIIFTLLAFILNHIAKYSVVCQHYI